MYGEHTIYAKMIKHILKLWEEQLPLFAMGTHFVLLCNKKSKRKQSNLISDVLCNIMHVVFIYMHSVYTGNCGS